MTAAPTYLLAAALLPLFPLSMIFNAVFNRVRSAPLRVGLLLAWPQLGLVLLPTVNAPVSRGLLYLGLFTSVLYAFRALSLREVGQWIGYLATSTWALLWIELFNHASLPMIRLYAAAFSLPLVLLTLLSAHLEKRFGAAYTGIYGGLAQTVPRMSGVLVCVVLAAVAAPLSPAFFAVLATVVGTTATAPSAAVAVAGVWLLWSWAGLRLLQGLVVGPARGEAAPDMSLASTWGYTAMLAALVVSGFYLSGGLL